MLREYRSLKVLELRAEKADDGKQYLSGYAALYNSLSQDLGFWDSLYERILPGAFTRAIKEKQDVRHLINHDPNLVLGRTAAGTTLLSEDSKGLKFRTLLPDTSYARDLFESVSRGDLDECSFGFRAVKVGWLEEQENPDDPKTMRTIRELHDLDLFDISTVTYPAYPGTISQAERAMFPDGVPAEIRSHMKTMKRDADGDCSCACPECLGGDCVDCSNPDCADESCRCMDARAARNKPAPTRRIHGEDLSPDCFLIPGDLTDPKTRKLPWKFSTDDKTTQHLHNCLARFNTIEATEDEKRVAWGRLVGLCKERGIDPLADELKHVGERLSPEQIFDFQKDSIAIAAQAKVRAIAASL